LRLRPGQYNSCAIKSMEYIDRVSTAESLIALLCAESDLQKAPLRSQLCPPGTVLEVSDAEICAANAR